MQLERSDYDRALALVAETAAMDGRQPFTRDTLTHFLTLVPADWCGYYEFSWESQPAPGVNTYFVGSLGSEIDPWGSSEFRDAIASWPLRDRVCASPQPRKLSDFVRPAELRRNPWYLDAMRPVGLEHEIKLWLDAPPGTVRAFYFVRERGRNDFDERDRSVLALVRRHLGVIRDGWERRHRPESLTEREAMIVDLVAEGMSNADIGRALFVSPLTVRTHLEHVFKKLGVHSRTAAVAAVRNNHLPL